MTRLELPSDEIGCRPFLREPDGTIWLCSFEGIWQGKNGHWNQVTKAVPGSSPAPERIYRTSDSQLWIAQNEGNHFSLHWLIDGRLQQFTTPEFPSDVTKGHRSKEIADELGIGVGTVNTYVRQIYEKLHVRSRAEAVARFVGR